MNVHSPERQSGESKADYRARQQLSRDGVAASQSLPPTVRRKAALSRRDKHHATVRLAAMLLATAPKFAKVRKHKPRTAPLMRVLDEKAALGCMVVGRNPGRIWRAGEPVHNLNPNRERDNGKRQKPKSAVAKRMDRPHRSALIERGHVKLMRFLCGF